MMLHLIWGYERDGFYIMSYFQAGIVVYSLELSNANPP